MAGEAAGKNKAKAKRVKTQMRFIKKREEIRKGNVTH